MKIIRVGVDISKSSFHVHAVDRHDQTVWNAALKRDKWVEALCDKVEPGALIALEACASSNHWWRVLQKRGYQVRLISALFVKPYVKSNKSDKLDAEAICEAASRPNMRFVAVKSVSQQDLQAVHRVRSELIKQRTAKVNQTRGLVAEYGLVAPLGIHKLRCAIPCWLEDAENGLSEDFRQLLAELYNDLQRLDERIDAQDNRIERQSKEHPIAKKLMTLRGIGPLTATALAIALGDGSSFNKGKDFAASLGLTPRQHSTGGKEKLLGISKRGNSYLRTLLIHGARAVLYNAHRHDDNLSQWVEQLAERKHKNIATVALANKTARIAWAIVKNQTDYDQSLASGHP